MLSCHDAINKGPDRIVCNQRLINIFLFIHPAFVKCMHINYLVLEFSHFQFNIHNLRNFIHKFDINEKKPPL